MNIYTPLFLLSHMRANTSLMGHILGSHAQISGYYEMHLSYKEPDDFEQQRQLFLAHDQLKPSACYLFDKLLHNHYTLDVNVHTQGEMVVLVSLRHPIQSLKSTINLFATKTIEHPYAQLDNALEYLVQRLEYLATFCQQNSHTYYYFDADLIRKDPDTTLPILTKWLALETPLVNKYHAFSQTGKAGAGDSSKTIYTGHIVKQATDYSQIDIPSTDEKRLQQAYDRYRKSMIRHAKAAICL